MPDILNSMFRNAVLTTFIFFLVFSFTSLQAQNDDARGGYLIGPGDEITGKVLGEIVSKTVKLHALQTWADRLGIPMSQTVAVGDGANDIPMIQAAGLGLAFCAKPKTQLAADKAINDRDLTHVLDYLRR